MKNILIATLAMLGSAAVHAANVDQALIKQGEYLARAGDCVACHTAKGGKPFAGGLPMETPIGTIYSTNITPDKTGVGEYSFEDFDQAVRHGVAKNGSTLYPAMPYPSYARVSETDMQALYAYFMHGVEPVAQENKASDIPWPLSMRWPLMGKLSTARWVWAPYRASTGTCSSPMLSRSIRVLLIGKSLHQFNKRNRGQQFAGGELPGVALPTLEPAFAQGQALHFTQRAPGLIETEAAPVPRQGDVGGCVEQQTEGGFSDGPRGSRRAAGQITTFGQVVFDQARLVRIQRATDLAAHPAPAFKVRLLVQGRTHDPRLIR